MRSIDPFRLRLYLLLPVVLVAAAPAARADAPPAAAAPRGEFAKGTWSLSLYGGYVHGDGADEKIGVGAVGVGYYFVDDISINAEFRGYGIDQTDAGGTGTGAGAFNLLIRHHLIKCDPWTLYIDASVGVFYADDATPPGGTHFNFVEDTGLGVTYRLGDGVYLMGGARYFHLSNAQIQGEERNPSVNGVEGYFGLMWAF